MGYPVVEAISGGGTLNEENIKNNPVYHHGNFFWGL